MKELANVLEIDVRHVQDAVSLYCRLGFARKKNAELDNNDLHPSWYTKCKIHRLSSNNYTIFRIHTIPN